MANNTFIKSPAARLDYEFDWSAWLPDGDTIASYELTIPTGLIQVAAANTTTAVAVTLSGGTLRARYEVICKITTAAGLIDQRKMYFQCEER